MRESLLTIGLFGALLLPNFATITLGQATLQRQQTPDQPAADEGVTRRNRTTGWVTGGDSSDPIAADISFSGDGGEPIPAMQTDLFDANSPSFDLREASGVDFNLVDGTVAAAVDPNSPWIEWHFLSCNSRRIIEIGAKAIHE
jgi:hypothetical protein